MEILWSLKFYMYYYVGWIVIEWLWVWGQNWYIHWNKCKMECIYPVYALRKRENYMVPFVIKIIKFSYICWYT